jgi:hypothetical protein
LTPFFIFALVDNVPLVNKGTDRKIISLLSYFAVILDIVHAFYRLPPEKAEGVMAVIKQSDASRRLLQFHRENFVRLLLPESTSCMYWILTIGINSAASPLDIQITVTSYG